MWNSPWHPEEDKPSENVIDAIDKLVSGGNNEIMQNLIF